MRLDTQLITPRVSILEVTDFINYLLNNVDYNNNNDDNKVGVSLEEIGYSIDHPRCVDPRNHLNMY